MLSCNIYLWMDLHGCFAFTHNFKDPLQLLLVSCLCPYVILLFLLLFGSN